MNRFWNNVIRPVIESINASYIVEVGSDTGINTRNILEYCVEHDAHMTAIDPLPKFDIDEFKAKYGDKFEIYRELSLSRLPLLEDYDVILLDGDHNWYTVYNELKIIEKSFKGKEFPVVILHDIGWPYARRDLYYDPENIPEAYRQPYKKLGMYPGQTDLKEHGGLNYFLYNSIYENNPKNGVLTAVEDFIDESDLKFSFKFINAFHGLGILFLKNDEIENTIKKVIESTNLLNNLEEERVKLTLARSETNILANSLKKELTENKTKLEHVDDQLKSSKGLVQKKEEQIENIKIQLNQTEGKLEQTENKLNSLNNLIKEKEEQLDQTKGQLNQMRDKLEQTETELKSSKGLIEEKEKQLENTKDQLNQVGYKLKQTESQLKSSNKLIQEKQNLIVDVKKKGKKVVKELNSQINNLKVNLIEMEYLSNKNRSITQRIISKFPSLYILFNVNETGIKNALVNIKGYKSIKNSNLVDIGFYLTNNDSVKLSGMDPILHYIYHGFKEGKKPNPAFNSDYYLKRYKDVKNSNLNPLVHYSLYGKNEGRKTKITKNQNKVKKNKKIELGADYDIITDSGLFDDDWYLKNNRDVARTNIDPLVHFICYGVNENRDPSPNFSVSAYLQKNKDVALCGMNPLTHYIKHGIKEGRKPISNDEYKKICTKNTSMINLYQFKEDSPLVSIIILNKNGITHLKRLFKDFQSNIQYPSYEILIVDNASKDKSIDFLENISVDLPIKIIKNNKNVSFSKANNQAAEVAEGEYLLLLNNDVEPLYGWLNQMMQIALRSEDIGAVGAKLVYPDVSTSVHNKNNSFKVQHAGIAFRERDGSYHAYNRGTRLNPFDPIINSEKSVAGVTGAALLVKKDTYLKMGGLDEDYYYGYEDVDFCLKLLKSGYINVYCPEALIFHYEHGTDEKNELELREQRRVINENILIRKWNEWLHKQFLMDKISHNLSFSEKPLKIAFTVTEKGVNASAGDYFTALEFSESLRKFGHEISFLTEESGNWYEVKEDVDVLVCLLHNYDPREIKCSNNFLIKVAWPRNWFDKWVPNLQEYDIVLASSKTACNYLKNETGLDPILMPIGTNQNRFSNVSNINKKYSCDYCFTGSYWNDPRKIIEMLDPGSMPYIFKLYGKNWDQINKFKEYNQGFLSYFKLPELYASTKIVIDDANRVTKKYGAVNSRVYDALASGTLVLTNGEIGANETFEGKLPVFKSKEELNKLIRYYMENESARIAKIKELQKFVLENHTYDHRAQSLMDILKDYILKTNTVFKNNFITDPSITLPYLESKNPVYDPNYLKVAVFIEGELKSLKSCPYLRLYSPLKHLSLKERFKIFIYSMGDFAKVNPENIMKCKLFDAIIIQRGAIGIETAKIILKKCKNNDIKVIYETDDDLLSIDKNNKDYSFFKNRIMAMDYLIKNVDLVTVSTDVLSKRFNDMNNNTIIVRNYLVDELRPIKNIKPKGSINSVNIGYYGTLTHDDDLLMIKDPICKIISKFKEIYDIEVKFHIIGGMIKEHEESWFTKVEIPDNSTDFAPFMNWVKNNVKFDIMLAPLKDTAFNNTKSELKYIEYTALGIPGIYSDLPPYNSVIQDGVNGLIAKDNEEWEIKLEKLILDQDLRVKIVKNGQEDIQKNYLKDRAEEWQSILQNIVQIEKVHNFKISIILPIYNMEKYLRKTLESIEKQTIGLENLEVLMINEASTDGSKLIIDEYAHKYENFIAVHLPKSSGTPGKPRNIGMDMANGEYLMFIDHDDFYSADACEILYNKISKEGVDIVSGIYNFIHGNDIIKLDDKKIFGNENEIKIKNINEKEELLTLAPVVWSKIFRKSFIDDNSLRFPVGVLAEDLIFLSTALLKANGILFLNHPVYNYRVLDTEGETSLSQTRSKEWFKGICDARKMIWNTYQKEGNERFFKQICKYSLNYLLEVFIRSDLKFEDKYEILESMYWIFEKSNDYGILPPKKYLNLFNSVIEKDYKNAILLSEDFIN